MALEHPHAVGDGFGLTSSVSAARDNLICNLLAASSEYSVVATDSDGRIVLWNEGARGLYGYAPSETLGQPLAWLHRQAGVPADVTRAIMERAFEDGKWGGTVTGIRKDKTAFTASLVATSRRSAEKPIGFLLMSSDITNEVRLATAFERSRTHALAALESAPDAMVIVDAEEQIQIATNATEKLFGYRHEELIGHPAEMLISNRDGHLGNGMRFLADPRAGPMNGGFELTGRRKDGVEFPVEIRLSSSQAESGLATVAIRDVTERRRLDQDLREAAESLTLLEAIQSAAPIGFGFVDRDFRIRRMNDTLASVNGLALEEQLGRTVAEVRPDLWPQLGPIYAHVLETGEPVVIQDVQGELRSVRGDASRRLTSYYPVSLNDEVIGVGLIVVDITDREEADDFRAVVFENMEEGLTVSDAEGRLVFMNATASSMLGWSEDELLGSSAHAAIHYQRADGSPLAEADSELWKVQIEGRTVRTADDAFTRKDGSIFPVAYSAAPLHSGKSVSGVVVVFHDTSEEKDEQASAQRALDALSWVGRIRDALDDDRLQLYSQPIVPLTPNNAPRGELLLRMIGQKGEIILPGSFLPAAEKYGQIWEIDQWVITQAAVLAASGQRVHANLSAHSVGSLDLLSQIERELSEVGADPANLVFEITETAVMRDVSAGEALARGLARLGCGFALDDFGIGYGSFTYLQKLPFTYLKIDIGFVRDLVSNVASQHLVRAIVNIAHEFGQQTIAEGVEDGETLDLLREYGVDLAQGFHLGRPHPVSPLTCVDGG